MMRMYHKVGRYYVHEDVFTTRFSCDYDKCKGFCCWGDGGFNEEAVIPLTCSEAKEISANEDSLVPYMHESALPSVRPIDRNGHMSLSICGDGFCVFNDKENGCCGLKRAHSDGVVSFPIPVHCALHPLIVSFNSVIYVGTLYDVCGHGFEKGERECVWLIDFVAPAIERYFGGEFLSSLRERQRFVLERKGMLR